MKNSVLILSVALVLFVFPQPVNPAQYPERMDYGTLTVAEQEAFNAILSAVAEGQAVVRCEKEVNHDRVRTHLGLYYGTVKGVGKLYTVVNGNIHLNLNAFSAFRHKRAEVQQNVDEALPHIREGSERYQLWQIARYIGQNYSYRSDFVCSDYAILFYKIASRLGIECHLCFGYGEDSLHVWNRAAGRYYDITWYDSTGSGVYIGSKTQWGRNSAINDLWAVIEGVQQ